MRVIICGAGRVGEGIARRLAKEKHSIVMIDADAALIDQVSTDLDVRCVIGHAAYPDTLQAAGIDECEMIIAVTQYDEVNMVICQIAHSLFNVPTKIARVRAQAYLQKFAGDLFARDGLPIDLVISPEIAVGDAILQRINTPGALTSVGFAKDNLKFLGFEIDAHSPIIDTALDQFPALFPELEARIVGIGRGKHVFAPRGKDKLLENDRAYIVIRTDQAKRFARILNREQKELRHIVIIGGGNIGHYLASRLEEIMNLRVRIIENNLERAQASASLLRKTIVIKGDGLNADILNESGIANTDFAIALTNDDKTNLLISNLAKRLGAKRTLALVNDTELSELSKDMRVDVVLDPRALTVSQILQRMRRGRILRLHTIENGDAEIAEGELLESSPLIGKALDDSSLPDGVTAAALIRDEVIIFPDKGIKLRAGDKVVIFYEQALTQKVERYFRVSPEFF